MSVKPHWLESKCGLPIREYKHPNNLIAILEDMIANPKQYDLSGWVLNRVKELKDHADGTVKMLEEIHAEHWKQ